MNIIQIATLITPDGAYGGPVRVAVNQTRALREAGHEVTLAAGAWGFGKGSLPTEFDGIPVKLFRAGRVPHLGFSGTAAPGLIRWLRKNMKSADIVHIHMSRDMVTLPSALIAGRLNVPYILQTHGMIARSRHPLARPVDSIWTDPAIASAKRVLYLTDEERTGLEDMAVSSRQLVPLPNGVPLPNSHERQKPSSLEVLFLARLHARKRPLIFVEMARRLHAKFPMAKFVLVGPDGGEGSAVENAIRSHGLSSFVRWEGPLSPEHTAERISQCDLYVLPSVKEPFPMSVLEALSLGKPVVITDTCGIAPSISRADAGYVVSDDLEPLIDAVSTLIEDGARREQMAANAKTLVLHEFSMDRVARILGDLYEEARCDA